MASTPFPLLLEQQLARLGKRVALARRAREMTQDEMAFQAGVSISTIAALERGHPGVAIGSFLKVLKVLDLLDQLDDLVHPQRDKTLVAQAARRIPSRAP